MCGITGFWQVAADEAELHALAKRMSDCLRHRGPDDEGTWVDSALGVGLGFRRLAILDLTPDGHQPMLSASGRFVMIFNGEVYNYTRFRPELESLGHRFHSRSDTEVMLAAFEQWGVAAAVQRFIGMFAIAVWDQKDKALHLIRDRLGIKPVYYGWSKGALLFGSELKALRAHPSFEAEIDRDSLALFLRHNYVPTPNTIYRSFRKLPAGTILTLHNAGDSGATPQAYWSARDVVEAGVREPFVGSPEAAAEELEALLSDAVALRMIADVPLGAFLSGGIDSSTVVALMQAQSNQPVRTFTIGFHEDEYDEAADARDVARHLETDHTELYLTASEAQQVIPQLPEMFDEPFADSSQIPTYLVSRLARQEVTVSLSGDGGDELFGGYNRYFWGRELWGRISPFPTWLRGAGAGALRALRPETWNGAARVLRPVLPHALREKQVGDKLHKLAGVLGAQSPEALYLDLVSHWPKPADVVTHGAEAPTALTDPGRWARLPDFTQRMMYLDLVSYLPDDILTKVDRASMAVSLEARVPMLDHRVVEFAWRLPLEYKVRGNSGKHILRQVLYRHVPRALVERPKMGFGIPIDSWLRGPLRAWAEDLLDEHQLRRQGYLRPDPIRQKWNEHLSGARNWQYLLWDILMFQAWLQRQ